LDCKKPQDDIASKESVFKRNIFFESAVEVKNAGMEIAQQIEGE